MHLSFRLIALTLEVNLQTSVKEACAVRSHKGIRRLLPALITPEKTALREKCNAGYNHSALWSDRQACELRPFKIHISKTKRRRIDHHFNWDQTQTVQFLFYEFLQKAIRVHIEIIMRKHTEPDFHHPFIVLNPDCLLAGMEKCWRSAFVKKTLKARSLLSPCESTFLFKHTRTRFPHSPCDFFVSMRSFTNTECVSSQVAVL